MPVIASHGIHPLFLMFRPPIKALCKYWIEAKLTRFLNYLFFARLPTGAKRAERYDGLHRLLTHGREHYGCIKLMRLHMEDPGGCFVAVNHASPVAVTCILSDTLFGPE